MLQNDTKPLIRHEENSSVYSEVEIDPSFLNQMSEQWNNSNNKLLEDMITWDKKYNHRNPCKQFKEKGFCKHMDKARFQYFRNRIKQQLEVTSLFC